MLTDSSAFATLWDAHADSEHPINAHGENPVNDTPSGTFANAGASVTSGNYGISGTPGNQGNYGTSADVTFFMCNRLLCLSFCPQIFRTSAS